MEFIQSISSPYVATLLLGLVFVLDPCTLLSNIAAIGYLSKDYTDKRQMMKNYLLFVLGRVLTLSVLAIVLVLLFKESILLLDLQNFFSKYSEIIIATFFTIIGLLLIFADKMPFLRISFSTEKIEKGNMNSALQAFMLGALISLVFCPTNIVLFFAMFIPLAVSYSVGIFLPFVFAISSTVPIIIIMLIMVFSINSIDKFFRITDRSGKYIVKISGVIFLLVGLYMFVEHLFFHYH